MKIELTDEEVELLKEALSVTSIRYEYMANSKEYKEITTETYVNKTLIKAHKMFSLADKILAIEIEEKKTNKRGIKYEKA